MHKVRDEKTHHLPDGGPLEDPAGFRILLKIINQAIPF